MHGYKKGATRTDINRIRELNVDGKTVDEISRALLIVPECIQSFVDKLNGKKTPKRSRKATPPSPPPEPPPIPE